MKAKPAKSIFLPIPNVNRKTPFNKPIKKPKIVWIQPETMVRSEIFGGASLWRNCAILHLRAYCLNNTCFSVLSNTSTGALKFLFID
jgi:hypothetical protein